MPLRGREPPPPTFNVNELIAFVASKTGWYLEYIRSLSIGQFNALVNEFTYQARVEQYGRLYGSALIVCVLANSKHRQYKPKDIIGEPPERERRHMENLGATPEIKRIKLADGKEYEVGAITLNILCDLEDQYKEPFGKIFDGRIKPLRTLIFRLLKVKYPELTEERLGELVPIDTLPEIRRGIGF